MNFLIKMLIKLGIQRENLDYHLIRAVLERDLSQTGVTSGQ
jgi:hypothetical protein